VASGLRTGRSPKDKRIVYDANTKDVSKIHSNYWISKFGGETSIFQLSQKVTLETGQEQ